MTAAGGGGKGGGGGARVEGEQYKGRGAVDVKGDESNKNEGAGWGRGSE